MFTKWNCKCFRYRHRSGWIQNKKKANGDKTEENNWFTIQYSVLNNDLKRKTVNNTIIIILKGTVLHGSETCQFKQQIRINLLSRSTQLHMMKISRTMDRNMIIIQELQKNLLFLNGRLKMLNADSERFSSRW